MTPVATNDVSVKKMPSATLDFLEPFALRNGHGKTKAGVLRFAAIELESRLRREGAARGDGQGSPAIMDLS